MYSNLKFFCIEFGRNSIVKLKEISYGLKIEYLEQLSEESKTQISSNRKGNYVAGTIYFEVRI